MYQRVVRQPMPLDELLVLSVGCKAEGVAIVDQGLRERNEGTDVALAADQQDGDPAPHAPVLRTKGNGEPAACHTRPSVPRGAEG